MKKRMLVFLMFCMVIFVVAGCVGKEKEEKETKDKKMTFYYLNEDKNGLFKVKKEIDLSGQDTLDAVLLVMEKLAMDGEEDSIRYHSVLNDKVHIKKDNIYVIPENEVAVIDFDSDYLKMDSRSEILVRAAIVKTLVQLKDISTVTFMMDEMPYTDIDGNIYGFMRDDDFVMDNDKKEVYNYTETVELYYANLDGSGLTSREVDVEAMDNESLESAVLKALRTVGEDDIGSLISPIPEGMVFNRVNVVQNICYLDVSSEIENPITGVDDEYKIYAIVNTLTSLERITQVQFTIDGELHSKMNEFSGFDRPLSCDYNYNIE